VIKTVTFKIHKTPPTCPTMLSPLDWRELHNKWLNANMCTALEDTTLPGIPSLDGYIKGV